MNGILLAILLLAPQDEDGSRAARRQQRELQAEITELEKTLKETEDPARRRRLQAALDRLKVRLKHVKEGKIRPERDEPENEEEELAQMLKRMDTRIKANPSDIEARVERAEILMELGKPQDALKDIQAATKIEPGEPFLYALEGKACLLMKKETEAKKAFAKAIEIEPDAQDEIREILSDIAPDRAAAMLSSMMKMAGPQPVNLADVTRRLRENPKDVEALVLRARHSREQKKLDAAFNDLFAALRINPKYAPAYFQRALTYAALGRFDRVERDFYLGERYVKPGQFRMFRQVEREIRRYEHVMDERERSAEDIDAQIETLKERVKELEQAKSRPGATAEEKARSGAQLGDVQAEIGRLAKLRDTRPEGEEGWEAIERMHEKLESHERRMRALADRIRESQDEAAVKKLTAELRTLVVRFHDLRHEVLQKEIKQMRHEMEDLKFEIREYKERKEDLIRETLEHLAEGEEE